MASTLSARYFHNEAAAYDYVEARLWPDGPFCPHCGECERISAIKPNPAKRVRIGLKKCGSCRKQFTVKVGTIFEHSHVPMHMWLQAIVLICASKKGIQPTSSTATLGVTLKTAWFMSHRIREAMRGRLAGTLGGNGGDVEVDETYIGHDHANSAAGGRNMHAVLSLVDRDTGRVRSMVLDSVTAKAIIAAVAPTSRRTPACSPTSRGLTSRSDGSRGHESVNHSAKEYVRADDPSVHTQTVEGTFSIFKRGMRGIYQHCAHKHLHRYLAEFDFRYSNRIAARDR